MGETKLIRREGMEITVPQLPQDVVMNILSRLPVKYLIQLKCVCKPWKSFISDPPFAKLQLAQSTKNNLNCDRLRRFSDPPQTVDYEDSADGHDLDHVYPFEYPAVMKKSVESSRRVFVVGSCNGLICVFFSNGRIFLWNPTIREPLELANNDGDFHPTRYLICGFGYDCSINDYKVVKTSHPRQANDGFSVKAKLYELVELLDSIKATKLYQMNLNNSRDSLLLFYESYYGRNLEAWHLKDYGVKSSWIKIFSNGCPIPTFGYWGTVLHYAKTGKIIFYYGSRGLVWYYPKENTWETIKPPQIDMEWFQHAIYPESLV